MLRSLSLPQPRPTSSTHASTTSNHRLMALSGKGKEPGAVTQRPAPGVVETSAARSYGAFVSFVSFALVSAAPPVLAPPPVALVDFVSPPPQPMLATRKPATRQIAISFFTTVILSLWEMVSTPPFSVPGERAPPSGGGGRTVYFLVSFGSSFLVSFGSSFLVSFGSSFLVSFGGSGLVL